MMNFRDDLLSQIILTVHIGKINLGPHSYLLVQIVVNVVVIALLVDIGKFKRSNGFNALIS